MEPQILMEELLIEILLRLPVKSLARFKCVSKSWFSLISDPHFVQSHFDLDHARNQRLLLSVDGALEIASIDFNLSLLHDDSTSAVLIPQRSRLIGFCREFTGSQIIGSCRGFTLFHYFPNFCIWKPCTGYIRKLPSSPIYSYANRPISTFLHGFGYDPLTDDYLVTIACREGSRGNEKTHVEIFSLRADAWEQFEGNQLEALNAPATFFSKVGLFFNDAIHWIACGYQRSVDVIVAFDLTKRVFTEIALPDNFHCVVEFCELRILGGFLSVCIAGCKDIDGEILVMKEYKVQSSWTKSHIVLSARNISTRYLYPICLTVGGDIVGIDGYTELVKFTDKGEVLERRDYYDAEEYAHQREYAFYHRVKKCGVIMHTESLFSLPCYN